MAKISKSRRRLLKTLAFVIASVLMLWKFLFPRISEKEPLLRVAKADIPANGALVFRKAKVAFVKRGNEVYALSLVCTHLGCSVNVTPREIICPCHGSVFGRSGEVLKGPADRPLERLNVEEQGESFVVVS